MEKERRSNKLRAEVRATEDQPKKIIGYAVKWDQLSDPIWGLFQERFQKGAFLDCLRSNPDVIASWQHDFSLVLGRTTADTLSLEEDDIGLRYEIIPPSWADPQIESIQRGDITGSSFTFMAARAEWDDTNPNMEIRTVLEASLIEVSPVTFPAYPQSEAGVRSAEDVIKEHRSLKQRDNYRGELLKKHLNLIVSSF